MLSNRLGGLEDISTSQKKEMKKIWHRKEKAYSSVSDYLPKVQELNHKCVAQPAKTDHVSFG